MPRSPRADEAGGLCNALNRGNTEATIFRKDADYESFERVFTEVLERYDIQLFALQLMLNHWYTVLHPSQDGKMSRFVRWVTATHTMRYHAHYHSDVGPAVAAGTTVPFRGCWLAQPALRYFTLSGLRGPPTTCATLAHVA